MGFGQLEFVVTFLLSFEMWWGWGGGEVGGGAEVWIEASQLCLGLINKSRHANCVCTQGLNIDTMCVCVSVCVCVRVCMCVGIPSLEAL